MPVPGRIKIDAVFFRERFDLGVFLQIFWRNVLDVMIDGEHRLRRIRDRRRADLLELWNHRAGVVMRHDMARTNRNEISSAHHCSGGESISVTRGNFLDEREAHIFLNNQLCNYQLLYFFAARLPRSLAISKSTKSA